MGFLSKLLGRRDPVEELKNLEDAINILSISVFGYLQKKVYTAKFGSDEAASWAMAVSNTMTLSPPGNEQARIFYENNEDQIWQEALQIKKYPELSGITGGASYLYFAKCYFATGMKTLPNIGQEKKSMYASKIMELEERAAQLGIFVPSYKDICDSNNPSDVVGYVCLFANEFIKKSMAG